MTQICPECSGTADVSINPPRYSLPKFHAACRNCGHEWNFSPPAADSRLG